MRDIHQHNYRPQTVKKENNFFLNINISIDFNLTRSGWHVYVTYYWPADGPKSKWSFQMPIATRDSKVKYACPVVNT